MFNVLKISGINLKRSVFGIVVRSHRSRIAHRQLFFQAYYSLNFVLCYEFDLSLLIIIQQQILKQM
jgi:hypothetical protein